MAAVFDDIIRFNQERGLNSFYHEAEAKMLKEELQELINAESEHDTVDALCDLIVLSVGGLYKLGYSPVDALAETINEISSRKGVMNLDTGKWEKDPNQDPSTLYKAQYKSVV